MGTAPSFLSGSSIHSLFPIRHYASTSKLIWLVITTHLSSSANPKFFVHRKGFFLDALSRSICNHNSFPLHQSYMDLRLLPTLPTFTSVTTVYFPPHLEPFTRQPRLSFNDLCLPRALPPPLPDRRPNMQIGIEFFSGGSSRWCCVSIYINPNVPFFRFQSVDNCYYSCSYVEHSPPSFFYPAVIL